MFAQPASVLTNAADVLALPAEKAATGIRVAVTGVVTTAEPNWNGQFFVQDATGGIFVSNLDGREPAVGDVVEVSGITDSGHFAPIIRLPDWLVVGKAALPEAKSVAIEQLMSGAEDGQRVQISGIVRAVRREPNERLGVNLMAGGFRLNVFPPIPPGLDPQLLVGAKVRVRGTAAASFNARQRRLITMVLFVPRLEDFIVEEPAAANPFDLPVLPLNSIAQYRKDTAPGRRIQVRGIVAHQRVGEDLFIQDTTGSLRVRTRQSDRLAVGDVVEVVGFTDFEHFLPVMQDAIFRKTPSPPGVVRPQLVTEAELQAGLHHADYITLQGRLLDRIVTSRPDWTEATSELRTVLMLQGETLLFTAELDAPTNTRPVLADVPLGSVVAVSGVCVSEIGAEGKLASVKILLPGGQSLRVLQRPGWWTLKRVLWIAGGLGLAALAAFGWGLVLRRQVAERGRQLETQIQQRQHAERQREIEQERARVAHDLHDDLGAALTEVSMFSALIKSPATLPAEKARYLEELTDTAVRMVTSLDEIVWAVNPRNDTLVSLPGYFAAYAQRLLDLAGVTCGLDVAEDLPDHPLDPKFRQELFLAFKEALTNVVRHSGATQVWLRIAVREGWLVVEVADNGCGFAGRELPAGADGVANMKERLKRLGGRCEITTEARQGTTVRFEVPLPGSGP